MHSLEKYANDKKKDLEVIKQVAIQLAKEDQLNARKVGLLIDRAFECGHYVGHCQGELHVKKVFDLE
jgi:hypothetical protein